jgi:hypothetical protein
MSCSVCGAEGHKTTSQIVGDFAIHQRGEKECLVVTFLFYVTVFSVAMPCSLVDGN